jgi:hypothetical protein
MTPKAAARVLNGCSPIDEFCQQGCVCAQTYEAAFTEAKRVSAEDFTLRLPRVEGQTREALYRQLVLFIDAARNSAITGAPFTGHWPTLPWGVPMDYHLLQGQPAREDTAAPNPPENRWTAQRR